MTEDAFAHVKTDRIMLDVPGSGRRERGAMLEPGRLREGDTVVVLDAKHLGRQTGDAITALGVTIETCPPDVSPKRAGAPPKFTPDDKQLADIAALWLNPGYTLAYVLRRASEIVGVPVNRGQLTHRLGNRHKRGP